MRETLLGVGALALAVVGVTQALLGAGVDWPWGAQAASAAQGPQPAQATPALRRVVRVEAAERGQFKQVHANLPTGTVVLDLEALESLDAALDLVQHWRSNHRADAVLSCWLATPDSGPALAAALDALSEQGCSALRLAPPGQPPAAHVLVGS